MPLNIQIIENKRPELEPPVMLCDTPLAPHLNNFEVTKFMNTHSVNLIIGKPASGKTSLLYSLFKKSGRNRIFRKVFHNIYLFMPHRSRNSLKNNIFSVLPENQIYDELTLDNLSDVMARIRNQEPDENSCIIFDDQGAYLKNNDTRQLFKELIYNRRHLHCSIFFLVQSWLSVEKDLRKLFSNIICFKVSKSEMENLFNEVIEQRKDHMLDIMRIVYDRPHQWMFINSDSARIFKMWDELLLTET